jgi:hypothetical protein
LRVFQSQNPYPYQSTNFGKPANTRPYSAFPSTSIYHGQMYDTNPLNSSFAPDTSRSVNPLRNSLYVDYVPRSSSKEYKRSEERKLSLENHKKRSSDKNKKHKSKKDNKKDSPPKKKKLRSRKNSKRCKSGNSEDEHVSPVVYNHVDSDSPRTLMHKVHEQEKIIEKQQEQLRSLQNSCVWEISFCCFIFIIIIVFHISFLSASSRLYYE